MDVITTPGIRPHNETISPTAEKGQDKSDEQFLPCYGSLANKCLIRDACVLARNKGYTVKIQINCETHGTS